MSELSSPVSHKSVNLPDDLESGNPKSHNNHQNGSANCENSGKNSKNGENVSWLHRPCLIIAEGIKWLPVGFISAVVCWSYYAFIVVVCIQTVESLAEKIIFMILYHIILFLFIWSYFKTIFAPKCEAPPKWKLSPAMVERLARATTEEEWKNLLELYVVEMEVSVMQRSVQGAIRYCDKCQAIKPDRSHHCSVCGSCILKMDHHCPWVNNCVAFNNYKFFILFLGYALIYTVFLALCNFKYFVQFWTGDLKGHAAETTGKFHILFLFFVSVMFCISVSSLFWYHVYLVLSNRSTLEQFRAPYFASGPDENGWGLGKRNNFQEVFGDRPVLWFFPVQTSIGDGLTFPTRINTNTIEATYQSTNSRQSLAAMASPAAKAVRGRSKDIGYIDEDTSSSALNNGFKITEVVMDTDEQIQVKVSKLPKKHDLMQLQ